MANELRDMFNDDPMDDFFGNFGRSMFDAANASRNQMKTDVVEHKNDYQVTSELPGFKKNDIHMDYRNNTLRIHATHKLNKDAKNDQGHVLRKERSNSDVSRAFYLPNVDLSKVSATYDGGLLKVNLPKIAKNGGSHQINIK